MTNRFKQTFNTIRSYNYNYFSDSIFFIFFFFGYLSYCNVLVNMQCTEYTRKTRREINKYCVKGFLDLFWVFL